MRRKAIFIFLIALVIINIYIFSLSFSEGSKYKSIYYIFINSFKHPQNSTRRVSEDYKHVYKFSWEHLNSILYEISLGYRRDILKLSYATLILIGMFFLVLSKRVSGVVSGILLNIPPIALLVIFLKKGYYEVQYYGIAIALIGASRILKVVRDRMSDFAKDDLIIYSRLGGNSDVKTALKYIFPQIYPQIIRTFIYSIISMFTLNITVSYLGMNDLSEHSLGETLYEIQSGMQIVKAFNVYHVAFIVYILTLLAFAGMLMLFSEILIDIVNRRYGLEFVHKKGKKEKNNSIMVSPGDFIDKIEIKNLSILSGSGVILKVDNLVLRKGDRVLIIGESGIGKTVLTNAILGIFKHSLTYTGSILYYDNHGNILNMLNSKHKKLILSYYDLEYIPQNPKNAFDRYTNIRTVLNDFFKSKTFPTDITERLSKDMDIENYATFKNDGDLQRMNFEIVMENLKHSKQVIVLADEPIASLSNKRVFDITSEFFSLFKDNDILLWIGHEMKYLDSIKALTHFFNKLIYIKKENEETKVYLYDSEEARKIIDEHIEKYVKIRGELRKLINKHNESREKMYELKLDYIKFPYRSKRIDYRNFYGKIVKKGEVVYFFGDNGTGKSTLMKLMIGRYSKKIMSGVKIAGEILYCGKDGKKYEILTMSVSEKKRVLWSKIDVIAQNPDITMPKYAKVRDFLKDISKESEDHLKEHLVRMGLKNVLEKRIYQLSYGQKKRLMLVRTKLKNPDVIFLDEPTASLDIDNINRMIEFINCIDKAKTIVIISHDPIFDVFFENGNVNVFEFKKEEV